MGDPNLSSGMLLGLGNPLLDISANTDQSFLEKYNLKMNDAILASDEHLPIYKDIVDNYKTDFIAGGACQNTMRVAQWIVQKPNVFAFMGSIGKDEFGKILESKAKEAGVLTSYCYHDTLPTGTCAVCITDNGQNRSLCANLSAANHFSKDHLEKPINQEIIKNAKFFYITGYFLIVSPPSIMHVAEHALQYDKPIIMNLSAPYICTIFKEPLIATMPYIDILFGNEQEAVEFAKEQGFGTESIPEIALKVCELPKKNTARPRIVIITQGHEPVICAKDKVITEYPVEAIKSEDIVDTNGAGDAFVGGFLAQYVLGSALDICIKCGIYTATECIKQSGCTMPGKPDFKL